MTERVRARTKKTLKIAGQLRAVIYTRVSVPGDKSPQDQEKVGRRDLAAIGVVVVAVFSDKASASRYRRVDERPGFVQTQDYIRAGKAEMLWTFAANRAMRDLDDYVPLRRLCIDTGTLWRYGNRTYDLTQSSDRRAANSDALRSEEFSDDLSEAISRGVGEALDAGRPHGKLPRGYRIVRDESTGKSIRREPIPEQAKVIRKAAKRVLALEHLGTVVDDLAPAWKRAGGKGSWERRTVRAMLINPTYAGRRTSQGKDFIEGTWKPILTLEEHQALCALLKDPKRVTHRGTTPTHLVTYIATCSRCGKPMVAKGPNENRAKSVLVVRCQAGHVSRPLKPVEDHVEALLLRILEDPEYAAKLAADDGARRSALDEDLELIARLRSEVKAYVKDAAKTRMSAAAVSAYVEEIETDIEAAQARVDAVGELTDPVVAKMAGPQVRKLWRLTDIHERRDLVRRVLDIVIHPVGDGPSFGALGIEVHPKKRRWQ